MLIKERAGERISSHGDSLDAVASDMHVAENGGRESVEGITESDIAGRTVQRKIFSGHESENIFNDLVTMVEAARKRDHAGVHRNMSALLLRGGLALDVMAAMLMNTRSRDCFLATSSLALDDDNMEAVLDVLDDVDAVLFIKEVFYKHDNEAQAQLVLKMLQAHEANMPAPDGQLAPHTAASSPTAGEAQAETAGFAASGVPEVYRPSPAYSGSAVEIGRRNVTADDFAVVPDGVHTCLGPCRWHNKPGGCRMTESECKFCHSCPKEKRPNKITRECQRLGMSKKQLQEKMRIESMEGYASGIPPPPWPHERQWTASLGGFQSFPSWPSGHAQAARRA